MGILYLTQKEDPDEQKKALENKGDGDVPELENEAEGESAEAEN